MILINLELAAMILWVFGEYDFDTFSQWDSVYPDPQISVTHRFWSKNIKPSTPSSNSSSYNKPAMDHY
ncbi:hypothetical protein BG74_08910 [Sodalis-like endosymbiont of Proechinophthirus fluctus]|uniref:hypothetical protein n=1 Tax=Sodalis-like endosymbiont of Proechinophthirus fluctus TaxID=1462730 RepID=UPI0007A82E00|nr:hypothetical protein [Sodalis-like endosymbiont of Proechinophthirus fluctus]KYP95414.1 hypothetical protein BG74_08910 [Sodalis-like endosymbiont of Proechinophthirus fluctus]